MFLTHLLLFAILLALVPSLRRFFGVVAMWALTFVQIAAVCWVVWLLWDRIVTYAEVAGFLLIIVVGIAVASVVISVPMIAILVPIVRLALRLIGHGSRAERQGRKAVEKTLLLL